MAAVPERATNTVTEGLNKIGKSLFDLKAAPDATPEDMNFLVNVETALLQHLRSPHDQAMAQQQGQGSSTQPAPDPAMMAPPMAPGMGGGGAPGGMPMMGGAAAGAPGGMGAAPGGPSLPPELLAALASTLGGGGAGPGAGAPAPAPSFGPAAVRGLRNAPAMPPVDELRRLTQRVR